MMRAVQFTPGGPENLTLEQVDIPKLRSKEVLVKVCATAVNRADTLQRRGLYPPPAGESHILGLEAAGIVDSAAADCDGRWSKCDRVLALLSGGGNAEYVAVHQDHLMPAPGNFNFDECAAIPEAWLTAYQLLHFVGSLKESDIVLIHAGASGVGTAAVQLVRLAGAVPYITAGSQHKIELAKSYGAEEGFNYKEDKFGERVLEKTGGRGVDMILDCVGASFWEENAKSAAVDSTWILYGSLGGVDIKGPILGSILKKRITLKGTLLRSRSNEYKARLVKSFTEKVLPQFDAGKLKVVINSILPIEHITDAHKMMEENRNAGKIVLHVSPGLKL